MFQEGRQLFQLGYTFTLKIRWYGWLLTKTLAWK